MFKLGIGGDRLMHYHWYQHKKHQTADDKNGNDRNF